MIVGAFVGAVEPAEVGGIVGAFVGATEPAEVGVIVGAFVGAAEVGTIVGVFVGVIEPPGAVGFDEPANAVGRVVGDWLGCGVSPTRNRLYVGLPVYK